MQSILNILNEYGLLAVFLAVFVEGMGLPLPAYPLLVVAAAMAPSLHFSIPELMVFCVIASLLPDFFWYGAGARYGTRIMSVLCRMSITPDSCAGGSSDIFVKFGPFSLPLIKFIPGVSYLGVVMAGAMKLKLSLFAFFDTIAAVLYIGVGVGLGVVFRDAIEQALASLESLGRWGGLIIVGLLGLYLLKKYVQRKWLIHRLKMDRITVAELDILLDKAPRPLILDARPIDQRERFGVIPGSVYAQNDNFDGLEIGEHYSSSEIIVYCACPNEVTAARMAQKLRRKGFKKIRPLLGGVDEWVRTGHTLEYPGAVLLNGAA